MEKLTFVVDFENERTAADSSHRAFASGMPFKLSDSSYSPRAIIMYYSRVLRECPVREDVNSILRGGGNLGETSGTGGATLRYILFFTYVYFTCLYLFSFKFILQ